VFTAGTHRSATPDETMTMVRHHLAAAGVTRVADITGLDHVGVPTTLALRPNATTMACSSGKGLTLDQAYVSGAMEAFELHAAETVALDSIYASYRDVSRSRPTPDVVSLPLTRNSLFNMDWAFHWCLGWDILTQLEVAVPMAMIGMSRSSMAGSLRAFLVSSNGLGAGNSFLEAVAAGLYEVLERDGLACHHYATVHTDRLTPLVTDSVLRSYPMVGGVLDKCDRASVGVIVQNCVVDTTVPIYNAFVYDQTYRGVPVTRGSGAHLDPEIALLRAVTEALQGRLNFIAGSRDDIFRSAFSRARGDWNSTVGILREAAARYPTADLPPSRASESFEDDITQLLDGVRRAGLRHVVVFDLTPADFPVFVVRVIVPGLEGYMHHGYAPGARAKAFAEAPIAP
jgi:ribosomal protein S12 methylthiotransferase accessory factor